jgi:hypothetical protein
MLAESHPKIRFIGWGSYAEAELRASGENNSLPGCTPPSRHHPDPVPDPAGPGSECGGACVKAGKPGRHAKGWRWMG